jgi:acarbose 7IV-phosphotransferase
VTTPAALDVAVIGAIGVDTVVYPPDSWSWEGESEGTLAEIQHIVGHGGGYASRGYAALGYRTAFVGHVGHDADGDLVRATLTADGIDLGACVTSGRTAHSVNVMSAHGGRRNFYDPRLTGVQPPSAWDVDRLLVKARMVHVNIPDWARTVIEPARRRGVVVVVDVQDTPGEHDAYRLDFVRGADLLFASAAQLDDPEGYARWAMSVGPASLVVIGLGADGCLVVRRDGPAERFAPTELPPDPVSGVVPPVVDTNGAGDSLAVGVASALVIDRLALPAAVRRGLLCARWCCTRRASSDGLLSASMLRDLASR